MNLYQSYCAILPTPFGTIGVRTASWQLLELVYLNKNAPLIEPSTALTKQVELQLKQYFSNPNFKFDLPIRHSGTTFQQNVWRAITDIPVGQVKTYGQIAKQISSAPRAVGQACGANFYPLIIPCHRVTAANGLGGFANQDNEASYHTQIKRWLLAHEGVHGYS